MALTFHAYTQNMLSLPNELRKNQILDFSVAVFKNHNHFMIPLCTLSSIYSISDYLQTIVTYTNIYANHDPKI